VTVVTGQDRALGIRFTCLPPRTRLYKRGTYRCQRAQLDGSSCDLDVACSRTAIQKREYFLIGDHGRYRCAGHGCGFTTEKLLAAKTLAAAGCRSVEIRGRH